MNCVFVYSVWFYSAARKQWINVLLSECIDSDRSTSTFEWGGINFIKWSKFMQPDFQKFIEQQKKTINWLLIVINNQNKIKNKKCYSIYVTSSKQNKKVNLICIQTKKCILYFVILPIFSSIRKQNKKIR